MPSPLSKPTALLIACLQVATALHAVECQMTDQGIASLELNTRELDLTQGTPVSMHSVRLADGTSFAGTAPTSRQLDGSKLSLNYSWGAVTIVATTGTSKCDFAVTITNTATTALNSFTLELMQLKFPAVPTEHDGSGPLVRTNIDAPSVLPLTFPANQLTMAIANTDVTKPLLLALPWPTGKNRPRTFPLLLVTGRHGMLPTSLPTIDRPIPPGGKDTFHISIRFSSTTTPPSTEDITHAFRSAFPASLKWSDRRPIGALHLATSANGWKTNPRGWFNDSSVDVTTSRGRAAFRKRLMKYADTSIKILRSMNAQGMIVWDIEGEEFPHATTYIGDPRVAQDLAPELRDCIDAFFARFREAGLKIGLTIRPQDLELRSGGQKPRQHESANPTRTLAAKIDWAHKRWGTTIFYIDSNGDQAEPIRAEVMETLQRQFPNVLIIPEMSTLRYHGATAPYRELRRGRRPTPNSIRSVYPDAFSVLNIADINIPASAPMLREAITGGDILLFNAWFTDPAQAHLRKLLPVD